MARERVYRGDKVAPSVTSHASADSPGQPIAPFRVDDERWDDELRPQRLDEVIGQKKVVERLRILLEAARRRQEPMGHLLLDGPPGLGKTTLALALARELGVECQITSGPAIEAPKDLLSYLTNASEGSVLFIDEIHRLRPAVEEFIYPVMEDFRVDIVLGEGLNARTINLKLKPFTLIGATTRSGMLTAPLRDRFPHREHLDFYQEDELIEIVQRSARKLRTSLDVEAGRELAIRSRGTPRKVNNLLRWVRDYATVHHAPRDGISLNLVREALAMLEVDALGLDRMDRRYLETLLTVFSGGPAGLQALGHTLNVSPDTLEDEVEPFLLRIGFITRTPRGRVATAAAWQHCGLTSPSTDKPQPRLFR
ncbi:MAG: Holliday junction ATP-dependent DNA helicase RuvB [Planctomycetaceae bacterium]|nr:MAG: Holliday junction ATP-dependent DNA helicase RuvB [Planctomycetaceae bacterium]